MPIFKDVKWKCRGTIHLVIGAVHYKFYAGGYLTKFPDDQFIAIKFIKMRDVFLKINIAKVGEIANNYVLIFNRRLYVSYRVYVRYGKNDVSVG
jgi:hypothetical protein